MIVVMAEEGGVEQSEQCHDKPGCHHLLQTTMPQTVQARFAVIYYTYKKIHTVHTVQ